MPTREENPIFGSRVVDQDYFSGSQAALYIGDVFVDEVTSYAFSRQHTKTPIYGYASPKFNAMADGPIIIQGTFAINFKESAYLYLVLQRYNKLFKNNISEAGLDPNNLGGPLDFQKSNIPSPFKQEDNVISRVGIERLLQDDLSEEEKYQFYNDLAGFASERELDAKFEDAAEVFEDRLWGTSGEALDDDDEVRNPDHNFFDGFDMYFVYGDFSNKKANHTVERISGVHIVGQSKQVAISGETVQEQYNFIARDSF